MPDQCQTIQAAPRFSLESRPEEASLLKRLLAVMPAGDSLVERVAWGSRFVAVRASGGVGLASTLGARPDDADHDAMAGLVGQTLADVASLLPSPSPILASLGLAALNAACPAPAGARAESVGELMLRLSPGRRVVVVGDFPFATGLGQVAARLDVLDLRQGHGRLSAGSAAAALGSCQVAAISSTALLTRTLCEILSATPREAIKVLVGPSTPWALTLLDLGVDIVGGSIVTNPGAVLEAVAGDLPFFQIKRRGVKLAVWQRPDLPW